MRTTNVISRNKTGTIYKKMHLICIFSFSSFFLNYLRAKKHKSLLYLHIFRL